MYGRMTIRLGIGPHSSVNLECRSDMCYMRLAANAGPKLECGPMPNLMVTLPNIGGALCSSPQSLPDAQY